MQLAAHQELQVLQCKSVSFQLGPHCCVYYSSSCAEFGLSLWWTSRDSSHPIFLACLGCSERAAHPYGVPAAPPSFASTVWVEFLSVMKKSPLDAAICDTIPYRWLAESICSTTHKARHEGWCLYAALTAAWIGTAWGLGTPVTWRATSMTQGNGRLLRDAARGVAIIFLQPYQRVSSVQIQMLS